MIKSQLALAVILVSLSMPALADWLPISGGTSGIKSTSINNINVYAASYNLLESVYVKTSVPCSPRDYGLRKTVLRVNDTPVNMMFGCDSQLLTETGGAASKEGMTFIFNEFKTKDTVKIGDWIFSAKGFTEARLESKRTQEKKRLQYERDAKIAL